MRNDFRQFMVYDLEIAARKHGASIPPMTAILPVWQGMQVRGEIHRIRGNKASLLIGDMRVDTTNDTAVMLVRISDQTTSNSVYSDPAAGLFQEHRKTGAQGSDFGVHVLLSALPERRYPNVYTCLIERVPGLSAELVRRLLSRALGVEYHRDATFYQYPAPGGGRDQNGNPRVERCRPHVELRGRPSQTLIADINSGRMTGVSLIKSEPHVAIAGASYLRKERSELQLSIDHNSLPVNLWSSMRSAMRRNSGTYPEALLRFRMAGTERNVSVRINTASGTPVNDVYIKSADISRIRPLLAQSSSIIVAHLVSRALPHLIANRTV